MNAIHIPLTPIESSNVAAIGYDEQARTLAVQFKSGSLYHYQDVPPEVNAQLWHPDTPSVGGYISRNVRGMYPATLQQPPEENSDE